MEETSIRKIFICQTPEILAPMTQEEKKGKAQSHIHYGNVDLKKSNLLFYQSG